MGLDMYLSRRSYVKNWDFMQTEEKHEITVTKGGKPSDIKPSRISYIIEEVAYWRTIHRWFVEKVAYWRKANAIHRWFVEKVQNGEDDCGEYEVSVEQLKELVDACNQVLNTVETVEGDVHVGTTYYPNGDIVEDTKRGEIVAQQGVAEKLLPTQGGFFFGSTNYDEYYLDDLRETVKMLTPLLDDKSGATYQYHASW